MGQISQYTTELAAIVCLTLGVCMMIAFTVGRRAGVRHRRIDIEGARSMGGAVEASIFGLLGLLIAFTFSGAADRFDGRRVLITEEANAIGTAWARLDLLSADDQATLREDFRRYLDERLGFYSKLPDEAAAAPYLERAHRHEAKIWTDAVEAAPRGVPGVVMLLLPALNQMFDVAEERKAALITHPPLPIYGLLMCLSLICSGLAGHHAAASARHPLVLPLLFSGVSALSIYVILDLEYPRAGLIRIDSADMLLRALRAQMS
jgi:hypothetical protein